MIKRARRVMDCFIITRNDKPEAVIMGIDEYESWVETLEILARPGTVQGIREGFAEVIDELIEDRRDVYR